MLSMKEAAELPDSVAEEMLQAGGKVIAETQRRHYLTLLNDTGTLAKSVKVTRMKRKRDGNRFVTIYPQGTHHTYAGGKKATNNEVAFVHEYGAEKRGISAKQIIRTSNEESAAETTAVQYKVYDQFLNKNNL